MVYPTANTKPKPPSRKPLLIGLGMLVILSLVVLGALYFTNRLPFWQRTTASHTTGNSYTKGEPATPSTSTDQSNTDKTNSESKTDEPDSNNTPPITGDLVAPWGTYSNEQQASLSDNKEMVSTCNTTPGATCQVIFTNGTLTKSLEVRNTDAGGAVYWSWQPKNIGLTVGTWHETMKATLGTQTKTSSNDPLVLEVTP